MTIAVPFILCNWCLNESAQVWNWSRNETADGKTATEQMDTANGRRWARERARARIAMRFGCGKIGTHSREMEINKPTSNGKCKNRTGNGHELKTTEYNRTESWEKKNAQNIVNNPKESTESHIYIYMKRDDMRRTGGNNVRVVVQSEKLQACARARSLAENDINECVGCGISQTCAGTHYADQVARVSVTEAQHTSSHCMRMNHDASQWMCRCLCMPSFERVRVVQPDEYVRYVICIWNVHACEWTQKNNSKRNEQNWKLMYFLVWQCANDAPTAITIIVMATRTSCRPALNVWRN